MSSITPKCCQICQWLMHDYDFWGSWYDCCGRFIWLPYKKQACKRQRSIKEGEHG